MRRNLRLLLSQPLPTRERGFVAAVPPPPCGEGLGVGGRVMPNVLARALRNNATPAERVLWQQLRLLKAEGRHFRRQVPIAGYVADFACHYPKLIVELDGGQHGDEKAVAGDAMRTRILNAHGYTVLKFWNSDVLEALEGVVDRIRHEVRQPTVFTYETASAGATPTPNPSPQGGGGLS